MTENPYISRGFRVSRRSLETSRNVPKRALGVVNTTALRAGGGHRLRARPDEKKTAPKRPDQREPTLSSMAPEQGSGVGDQPDPRFLAPRRRGYCFPSDGTRETRKPRSWPTSAGPHQSRSADRQPWPRLRQPPPRITR